MNSENNGKASKEGLANSMADLNKIKEAFGGWDGTPHYEPDIMVRAWWIDPYWYVSSTDGTRIVMSQQDITTDDLLQWCAGEHVRLLLLSKRDELNVPGDDKQ